MKANPQVQKGSRTKAILTVLGGLVGATQSHNLHETLEDAAATNIQNAEQLSALLSDYYGHPVEISPDAWAEFIAGNGDMLDVVATLGGEEVGKVLVRLVMEAL
jgi:hypothetical protein